MCLSSLLFILKSPLQTLQVVCSLLCWSSSSLLSITILHSLHVLCFVTTWFSKFLLVFKIWSHSLHLNRSCRRQEAGAAIGSGLAGGATGRGWAGAGTGFLGPSPAPLCCDKPLGLLSATCSSPTWRGSSDRRNRKPRKPLSKPVPFCALPYSKEYVNVFHG